MVKANVLRFLQFRGMFGQSIHTSRLGEDGFHLERVGPLDDGGLGFRHPTRSSERVANFSVSWVFQVAFLGVGIRTTAMANRIKPKA